MTTKRKIRRERADDTPISERVRRQVEAEGVSLDGVETLGELRRMLESRSEVRALGVGPRSVASAKQNRDREREKYRRESRVRAPAGFVRTDWGRLVPSAAPPPIEWVKPTEKDAAMLVALRQLVDAAEPLDPEAMAWPDDATERRVRTMRGKVPAGILARVRAAHEAAGLGGWEGDLRSLLAFAVSCRIGKAAPPPRVASAARGEGILSRLQAQHADLPATLTAEKIESAISSSTLTRGGGRSRKVNVNTAADRLIRSVRQTRPR